MLYPMTFKPILKSIIWGGSDICPFKGITPVQEGIGESWELSHVEGNYSIVDNGALEGKTLDELIRTYGKQLLGEKVVEQFGSTFPLLIKFIDAKKNLSVFIERKVVTFEPDELLRDGQKLTLAGMKIQVIHTPGHTPGGCSYYVADAGCVFSGDPLFAESVGRSDFPGGSTSALVRAVKEKLFLLPDDTLVCPGHGEETTIGHEKKYNPFM